MQVSVKQLLQETNQGSKPAVTDKEVKKKSFVAEEVQAEEEPLIKQITKDNILSADSNRQKRKEMIEAKGFEPSEFAFERAIGRNDSLYSNFIELLAITKRKVGRIIIMQDGKRKGFATGFMVSKNLMLTNWHVFPAAEIAEDSEVHFFYEYNAQGHPASPVVFKFDSNVFFNHKELDYCFVTVRPVDVTGQIALSSIGYLFLDKTLGKIGDVDVEKLNIIHHPQGDLKQISIRENKFVGINETKIFYHTDTAPGSSGAPVFNDQWQVVGLHHKSIAKMTADEKHFLDEKNNIIPVIDGTIDQARIVWLKNEGIRISVILSHLFERNPGNQHIAGISVAPPPETGGFMVGTVSSLTENKITSSDMSSSNNGDIRILVPVNSLSAEKTIDISLSSRSINGGTIIMGSARSLSDVTVPDEFLLEIAKADKEKAVDFSDCKGYDPDFLGVKIPLPQPKKALQKEVALLKNKTNELKYFKYSVIFNAIRKMPIISAVNVEGDAKFRKDNSDRNDDWLRDKRIDVEAQLIDKFYAGSQFDKGHMSRFEDANWDKTEAKAKRNGIYTCFYTNACPQVVALNRAGGFWGKLEKEVLEKGVKHEAGKQARMTVFNGPIFDKDKDRPFKGLMIPMQYFKIICWLDDNNKLKVTGFKLSQETLVDHIRFDELAHLSDLEALDIDQVTTFKEFQCTVKSLEKLTGIEFSNLEKFDTFKPSVNPDESEIINESDIML